MNAPPVIPDYELLRRIGGGSYGDVWLARSVTGQYRAVKIVRRDRFQDERPFLRELEGITRFQERVPPGQPTQVALLHVGQRPDEGWFHYVMELADDAVTGPKIDPDNYVALTLKELKLRRGRLPAAECLRLALELGQGLAVLHDLGLLHRDIKPSNIILVHGVPKLADLGLVSSSDQTLTSVGTPDYAPPEGPGSIGADLYSLGRVLYELLTGLPVTKFPQFPDDLEAEVGRKLFLELNEVILKAGNPEPANRYASAHELLKNLGFIKAGGSLKDLAMLRRRVAQLTRVTLFTAGLAALVVVAIGTRSYFIQRRALGLTRYIGDLNLAAQSIIAEDFTGARSALLRQAAQAIPGGLAGVEYDLLQGESAGDQAVVLRPGGPAIADSSLLAAGDSVALLDMTGRIELRRAATGELLRAHTNFTQLGVFAPDGQWLTAGRWVTPNDMRWQVLPLAEGATKRTLSSTNHFAGRMTVGAGFLTRRRGAAREILADVRDGLTGNRLAGFAPPPHPADIGLNGATSFAPAGPHLAEVSQTNEDGWGFPLYFWPADGAPPRLLHQPRLLHTATNCSHSPWAFSPDGSRFAYRLTFGVLEVHAVADQRLLCRLVGHRAGIIDAQFSPDGRVIATAAQDQTVRLWAADTGEELRRFLGHEGPVEALAWAPDGRRLYSGGNDGKVLAFETSAIPRRSVRAGLYRDGEISDFIFSQDGQRIAAILEDGAVSVLDTTTLAPLGRCPDLFQPVAFNMHGSVLGFGRDWSLRRQAPDSETYETLVTNIWPGAVIRQGGSLSDDGRWLALTADPGKARFFDLTHPEAALTLTNLPAQILSVAVSADGQLAVVAEETGAGVVLELPSGRERLRFRTRQFSGALAISPDHRWLALGTMNGYLELRSIGGSGGTITPTAPLILRGDSRGVAALRFSPDSRRLLSGGGDTRLIFWSVGTEATPLLGWPLGGPGNGYDQSVGPIHFSPDGRRLGVATRDGRLRVFNLAPNKNWAELKQP